MKGKVELFEVSGGVWRPVASFDNLVVDTGYDAMAKAMAGTRGYSVAGMYMQYTNVAPVEPVIAADRTAAYYRELAYPFGYVRATTLSEPVFTTSDATRFQSNMFMVSGLTDGSLSAGGAPLVDGTSQFISMALVAMPDYTYPEQDVLVSAAAITAGGVFTPVVKVANVNMGFRWSLRLGV